MLLKNLWKRGFGWDEDIDGPERELSITFLVSMFRLENIYFNRSVKPVRMLSGILSQSSFLMPQMRLLEHVRIFSGKWKVVCMNRFWLHQKAEYPHSNRCLY